MKKHTTTELAQILGAKYGEQCIVDSKLKVSGIGTFDHRADEILRLIFEDIEVNSPGSLQRTNRRANTALLNHLDEAPKILRRNLKSLKRLRLQMEKFQDMRFLQVDQAIAALESAAAESTEQASETVSEVRFEVRSAWQDLILIFRKKYGARRGYLEKLILALDAEWLSKKSVGLTGDQNNYIRRRLSTAVESIKKKRQRSK